MAFWQRLKLIPAPLALILLLTAGLHAQLWHHTLVWDEQTLTVQSVVLHPSWANYQRSVQENLRPLALLSVVLDRLVWRSWPPGYAADSLLYHLIVVTLFFHLIRRWVAPFPAAAATLLVALHPVGAESVNYLLGRPDLLSAACMLAALIAFSRLDQADGGPVRPALFWFWCLLAVAAKETALLLPGLTFLLIFDRSESTGIRSGLPGRRLVAWAPLAALVGFYAAARLGGWITVGPTVHMRPGINQLAVMASTTASALGTLLWPVDLCPWYEGRISMPSSIWPAAGLWLGGLAGAVTAAWTLRRRSPAVSLGLAWLAGILLLIALRAAADPAPMNPLAVRWLYPAVIGLALVAGGTLQHFESSWPRAGRLLAFGVILICAGLNWQAQSLWQNNLIVLGRAFQCSPHSPMITLQYAYLLERAGHPADADQMRTRLVLEQPEHPIVLSRRISDAIARGDNEQARVLATRLVAVSPSVNAVRRLADLETITDHPDDAITHYRRALASRPNDLFALTALGSLYERQGRWQEAAALYQRGVTLHPAGANLWFRYGRALEAGNHLGEAEAAFERVIELDRLCPDGAIAVARLQDRRGERSAAKTTRQRYIDLTRQPLQPRPVGEPTDSPCGTEPKVIYRQSGGQSPPTSP